MAPRTDIPFWVLPMNLLLSVAVAFLGAWVWILFSFSVGRLDVEKAVVIIEEKQKDLEFETVISDPNVSKISVVGTAMRSQPGVAKTMFETLAAKGVNIQVISTSEIKISVLIDAEYTELAVRSLHTAFGLDDE